jgi:uncharacterized protein YjbI with pentapeptide repeats
MGTGKRWSVVNLEDNRVDTQVKRISEKFLAGSGGRVQGADVSGRSVKGIEMPIEIDNSNLKGASFLGVQFPSGASINSNVILENAEFINSTMNDMEIKSRQYDGLRLVGCSLIRTSFDFPVFRREGSNGVNFYGSMLNEANLSNCCVDHSDFSDASMQNADLSGTDAANSSFEFAELQGADLFNGVFRDCDFTNADLRGADLRDADFTNCNFKGALLAAAITNSRTNFTGKKGLSLTGVISDDGYIPIGASKHVVINPNFRGKMTLFDKTPRITVPVANKITRKIHDAGSYFDSHWDSCAKIDEALKSEGYKLRPGATDFFPDKKGNTSLLIVKPIDPSTIDDDEAPFVETENAVVYQWYRMPSGRWEITAYVG